LLEIQGLQAATRFTFFQLGEQVLKGEATLEGIKAE
jgi:hypothetical protein